jgi:hypothetical protein
MLPVPVIDGILNAMIVRPRLDEIFDFRAEALVRRFGEATRIGQ